MMSARVFAIAFILSIAHSAEWSAELLPSQAASSGPTAPSQLTWPASFQSAGYRIFPGSKTDFFEMHGASYDTESLLGLFIENDFLKPGPPRREVFFSKSVRESRATSAARLAAEMPALIGRLIEAIRENRVVAVGLAFMAREGGLSLGGLREALSAWLRNHSWLSPELQLMSRNPDSYTANSDFEPLANGKPLTVAAGRSFDTGKSGMLSISISAKP